MSIFTRYSRKAASIGLATALLSQIVPSLASAEMLSRSHILLPSAKAVDVSQQTVTLPLHRGLLGKTTVWYVITDSSNAADAQKRGVVYAPLLAQVGQGCAVCVQHVHADGSMLAFAGAPSFSQPRVFVPSATGFPPAKAAPGAIADAAYSPFISIDGSSTILNAPIVATGNGPFDVITHHNTHPRVISINTHNATVKLLTVHGFANGKPVLYLSTEASDPGVATIERATYVPSLAKVMAGAVPIDVVANGMIASTPAKSQGLMYAALKGHLDLNATAQNSAVLRTPMNVLTTFPTGSTAAAYTPLWSASLGVWSPSIVKAHKNVQLTTPAAFQDAVAKKELTGPGGKPFGPIGVFVNCPVVGYLQSAP